MSDLSSIQTPSGETFNLKDAAMREAYGDTLGAVVGSLQTIAAAHATSSGIYALVSTPLTITSVDAAAKLPDGFTVYSRVDACGGCGDYAETVVWPGGKIEADTGGGYTLNGWYDDYHSSPGTYLHWDDAGHFMTHSSNCMAYDNQNNESVYLVVADPNGTEYGCGGGSTTDIGMLSGFELEFTPAHDEVQLIDRAVQCVQVPNGTTSLTLVPPAAVAGRIRDFVVDVDNSSNSSAVFLELGGLGDPVSSGGYEVVCHEKDDLDDLTTIAAGKMARLYFTETGLTHMALPVFSLQRLPLGSFNSSQGGS